MAANLATARLMGVADPNDLLGKTDADFYPPEQAAEYRADEERLFQSGQPLINKNESASGGGRQLEDRRDHKNTALRRARNGLRAGGNQPRPQRTDGNDRSDARGGR